MVNIVELPSTSAPEPALYVATPCYGCLVTHAYTSSILRLQAECMRRGITCFIDFIGNESLVQRARNVLTARFLKRKDFTHFLFIDADIAFDPETVFRMLQFDKDVTTAIYPKKSIDWDMVSKKLKARADEPVHQMGLDFNINIVGHSTQVVDGFMKVLDAATGFMMIKRTLLEKLAKTHTKTLLCENDIPGSRDEIPEYVALFDCILEPLPNGKFRALSEDYSFCRRVQDLGGDVYVDVSSVLCHTGNMLLVESIINKLPNKLNIIP